jgi:hypothetical protein
VSPFVAIAGSRQGYPAALEGHRPSPDRNIRRVRRIVPPTTPQLLAEASPATREGGTDACRSHGAVSPRLYNKGGALGGNLFAPA